MLLLLFAGVALVQALPALPHSGKVELEAGEIRELQSFPDILLYGIKLKLQSSELVTLCVRYEEQPMYDPDADPVEREICKKGQTCEFVLLEHGPHMDFYLENHQDKDLEVSYFIETTHVFSIPQLFQFTLVTGFMVLVLVLAGHRLYRRIRSNSFPKSE